MTCHVSYDRKMKDADVNPANAQAINALQQLVTLASGTLVLTLTFLKDISSYGKVESSLNWVVPIGWGLLILSIWTGWVSMAEAARKMGMNGSSRYIFSSGKLRNLARIAQWSFCAGLLSITLYGISVFTSPAEASCNLKSEIPFLRRVHHTSQENPQHVTSRSADSIAVAP
jgi:hypothetical protein